MPVLRRRRLFLAVRTAPLSFGLVVGVTACNAERLTSSARWHHRLALDASISTDVIGRGQPATFTYELRNISGADLEVIFGGCGPLPYIKDARGTTVHPGGGAWGCLAVVTTVVLAPGQAISRSVEVAAGDQEGYRSNTVTLPAGRYRAYADVTGWVETYDQRLELRSRDVSFQVRD